MADQNTSFNLTDFLSGEENPTSPLIAPPSPAPAPSFNLTKFLNVPPQNKTQTPKTSGFNLSNFLSGVPQSTMAPTSDMDQARDWADVFRGKHIGQLQEGFFHKAWDAANLPIVDLNRIDPEGSLFGDIGQAIGGKEGRKIGTGLEKGALSIASEFTSPLQLAFLVGSAGTGALWEKGAVAALKEAGMGTDEIATMLKGADVAERAAKAGKPIREAITAAGVNTETWEKGAQALARAGISSPDDASVLNALKSKQGGITGLGSWTLRKMGVGAGKAQLVSKGIQSLVDLGFTGQMAMSLAQQSPKFLDALKQGDYEEAAELGVNILANSGLTYLGVRGLARDLGEAYDEASEKLGMSQRPSYIRNKLRNQVLANFQHDVTMHHRDATVFRDEINKLPEFKGLNKLQREAVTYMIQAQGDHDTLARRLNWLAENAGRDDLKVPVNTQDAPLDEEESQKEERWEELSAKRTLANSRNYTDDDRQNLLEAYRVALDPTPEMQTLVKPVREFFAKTGDLAQDGQVIHHLIDNYVTHIWGKDLDQPLDPNEAANDLRHQASSGEFHSSVTMARRRVFDNAFEGQMLGRKLAVTDPIDLAAYERAKVGEALATKNALDKLRKTHGTDGMALAALSGKGTVIKGEDGNPAVMVRPDAVKTHVISDKTIAAIKKQGLWDRLTKQRRIIPVGGAPETAGATMFQEAAPLHGDKFVQNIAEQYAADHDLPSPDLNRPAPLVDMRAREIARAFDVAKHEPGNPEVHEAYSQFKKEIEQQWDSAVKSGITFEPWTREGQPYANSQEMMDDVQNNHHLYFFQGGDVPVDHPMAEIDPRTGLSYNDMFRAVHDLFGHAMNGYQFGPRGEEGAYQAHSEMFSPLARKAMFSETKAQNSWVNFGPHILNEKSEVPKKGEPGYIAPADRPFAEQKATIMPAELRAPDVDPEKVLSLLRRPRQKWAIMQADNPQNTETSPEQNDAATLKLQSLLVQAGYHPIPVEGHTSDVESAEPENAFLVLGIDPAVAERIEKERFRQSGIADSRGLVDLNSGQVMPWSDSDIITGDAAKQFPYYSVLKTPKGDVTFHIPLHDETFHTNSPETQFQETTARARRPEGITPEEWSSLRPKQRLAIRTLSDQLPSKEEFKAAAIKGEVGKHWYDTYKPAFRELLGNDKDFEKFTDLLAALSPRVPVRRNLVNALNFWADWIEAGRPTDLKALKEIGDKYHFMSAHIPNLVRALNGEELSGPKVGAFAPNLKGDPDRATLDTWMQIFAGQQPHGFGNTDYLAYQSRLRSVAKDLGWTTRQTQAAIWTFTKTLAEMAGLDTKTGNLSKHLPDVLPTMRPEDMKIRSQEFINLIVDAFEPAPWESAAKTGALPGFGVEEEAHRQPTRVELERETQKQEIRDAIARLGIDQSHVEAAKGAAERQVERTPPSRGSTAVDRIARSIAERLQQNSDIIAANLKLKDEEPDDFKLENEGAEPVESLYQQGGRMAAPQALTDVRKAEEDGFKVVPFTPEAPPASFRKRLSLSWVHPGLDKRILVDADKNQMHETVSEALHPGLTGDKANLAMLQDGWMRVRVQPNGLHNAWYEVGRLTPKTEAAIEQDLLSRLGAGVDPSSSGVIVDARGSGQKAIFTTQDFQDNSFDMRKTLRQAGILDRASEETKNPEDEYFEKIGARENAKKFVDQITAAGQDADAGKVAVNMIAALAKSNNTSLENILADKHITIHKGFSRESVDAAKREGRNLDNIKGATRRTADGWQIDLGPRADQSTVIHEVAHVLTSEFLHDPEFKPVIASIVKSTKTPLGTNGALKPVHIEEIARQAEAVHSGKLNVAPELKPLYSRIADFLRQLYRSIVNAPGATREAREYFNKKYSSLSNGESAATYEISSLRARLDAILSEGKNTSPEAVHEIRNAQNAAKMALSMAEKNGPADARYGRWMRSAREGIADAEKALNSTQFQESGSDREPTALHATHEQIGESPEAENRVDLERRRGIRRIRIDTRSGRETPIMNTVDAADVRPGPYDRIVMRQPNGQEELVDHGPLARGAMFQEAEDEPKPKKYIWNPDYYLDIDHPALKGWNWAVQSPEGVPVFVKGNLKVHPEAYEFVRRLVGADQSSLKNNEVLGKALKAGSFAKHTLLSLSPFHISQLGLRAIMSGVIPKTVDWNLHDDPQLSRGVRQGLTIGTRFGLKDYQEGLMSHGGLVSKVPGLRHIQDWLQEYTFEKLMPSLKVLVYRKLYERNLAQFADPKFRDKFVAQHRDFAGLNQQDAAARAAALETNERLGGINYKQLGRSAGAEDFLRLMTLAPDWLESEIRMVNRVFDPTGGRLLRQDLVKFTAGMWVAARLLNLLTTGKAHNEAPFGVSHRNKDGQEVVYSLRTLPTDMLHMAQDPAGFLKGRISPVSRAFVTGVTQRDFRGRKMTDWQTVVDITRNLSPIPAQAVGRVVAGEMPSEVGNIGQIGRSVGITAEPYKTEAEKKAQELASNNDSQGPVDPAALRRHQLQMAWEDKLRSGEISPDQWYQSVAGALPPKEIKNILRDYKQTRGMDPGLARMVMESSRLSMPQFLQVWDLATSDEKVAMTETLIRKKNSYFKKAFQDMTPEQRAADPTFRRLSKLFSTEPIQ